MFQSTRYQRRKMRILKLAMSAVSAVAITCTYAIAPATASEPSAANDANTVVSNQTYSADEDGDSANISRDGNVTTIEYDGNVTTVTEDPKTGDLTIVSPQGEQTITQEEMEASIEMMEKELDSPSIVTYGADIEKDWKKYLCGAASAVAVGVHESAWKQAVKIATEAVKTGKANPWLIGAIGFIHLGAGVFLSTQC